MAIICVILAVVIFLLMDHPIAFWLVFVPLAILLVLSIGNFFRGRSGVGALVTSWIIIIAMVVALVIVVSNDQCEHEERQKRYHFVSENSPSNSEVSIFCKECDTRLSNRQQFKGELVDKSYLSAIQEHSDGGEIVPGEYYTVTATVPMGFYATNGVWLTCRVENDEFRVSFNVEFREEFRKAVSEVEEGDEITFRGRFYDQGCGFTDCELISK